MLRASLVLALALAAGCSPLLTGTAPSPAAAAAESANIMKQMAAMQSARAAASVKCTPLASRDVPWPEERFVGSLMATRLLLKRPLIEQAELSQRVAVAGRLLASRSSRPAIPWTFGVVKSDTPESFAFPGGYVFLSSGLVSRMTNEAELAGVLAREVAHVSAGDPTRVYRDVTARQCEMSTMMAAMSDAGLTGGSSSEAAKYAKDFVTPYEFDKSPTDFQLFIFDAVMSLQLPSNEAEADKVGAELTAMAGYDVAAFEGFLTKLDAEPLEKNAEGKPVRTGYLAFKPATAERVEKLKALREGELASFAHGSAKPDLTSLVAPLKKQ